MRMTRFVYVGLLGVAACGASTADVEELKKGQKDILAKLDNLSKAVQQQPQRAAAAGAADPNKVYTIPVGSSPVKGRRTRG